MQFRQLNKNENMTENVHFMPKSLQLRQWLQQRTLKDISQNLYDILNILSLSCVGQTTINGDMAENITALTFRDIHFVWKPMTP